MSPRVFLKTAASEVAHLHSVHIRHNCVHMDGRHSDVSTSRDISLIVPLCSRQTEKEGSGHPDKISNKSTLNKFLFYSVISLSLYLNIYIYIYIYIAGFI